MSRAGKDYVAPKRVSSVWTVNMSTTDPQRVGYPNQKPLALIDPFIQVHTDPGELVIDPFAGSGSTSHAALVAGRRTAGADPNPEAVQVANERLAQLING